MQVDIILPVYKSNKFVFEAIDSVIEQTYDDWNLHIIDDHSEDGGLNQIYERYSRFVPKINFIQLNENLRAAGARNYAIERAKGEILAFIDQDDKWSNDKLMLQIDYMNDYNCDLVHSNILMINENGKIIEGWEKENNSRNSLDWENCNHVILARKLLLKLNTRLTSTIIKRSAFEGIGGFNTQYYGAEEPIFWVECAIKYKIGHIRKKLLLRREHDQNTSKIHSYERLNGYLKSMYIFKTKFNSELAKAADLKKSKLEWKLFRTYLAKYDYRCLYQFLIVLKNPIYLTCKLVKSR